MNRIILLVSLATLVQWGSNVMGQIADNGAPKLSTTIVANSFWSSSASGNSYSSETKKDIDRAIEGMPKTLMVTEGLSDSARASQLQWAVKVVNAIRDDKVTLLVPAGRYDFSTLGGAHVDTPNEGPARAFMPKLVVTRNHVTLQGQGHPVFTYAGPGTNQSSHGRVLLWIPYSAKGSTIDDVTISGIDWVGDQSYDRILEAEYSAHENHEVLLGIFSHGYRYGLIMSGFPGKVPSQRHIVIEDSVFKNFNLQAIHLTGGATISRVQVEGVFPSPSEAFVPIFANIEKALQKKIGPHLGDAFQTAIEQDGSNSTTTVRDSEFSHLNEGLQCGYNEERFEVLSNRFQAVFDHSVYILSNRQNLRIVGNQFTSPWEAAIKVGASSTALPLRYSAEIAANVFKEPHKYSLLFSGSFANVHDNRTQHDDSSSFPDYRITTGGGQAGWSNHAMENRFVNNQAIILLEQFVDAEDRSIAGNVFEGEKQTVYFHAKENSAFPAVIDVAGSRLIYGAPPQCTQCYPNATGYLSRKETNRSNSGVQ